MKISVLGMDPSMNAWGLAGAVLDLNTGILATPALMVIEPKKQDKKVVRVNSVDIDVADQLARAVFPHAQAAQIVFVEMPVGSQSAAGMKAYGICCGLIGALRSTGKQVIEVTAKEVKLALSGKADATKAEMIKAARAEYPEAVFPMWKGVVTNKAEHAADAIGAIHAGVKTPIFENLLQIMQNQGKKS